MASFPKPLFDNILVREIPVENATATGIVNATGQEIVTANQAARRPDKGEVIAVGSESFPVGGVMVPMPVKVGDIVKAREASKDYILLDESKRFDSKVERYFTCSVLDVRLVFEKV